LKVEIDDWLIDGFQSSMLVTTQSGNTPHDGRAILEHMPLSS